MVVLAMTVLVLGPLLGVAAGVNAGTVGAAPVIPPSTLTDQNAAADPQQSTTDPTVAKGANPDDPTAEFAGAGPGVTVKVWSAFPAPLSFADRSFKVLHPVGRTAVAVARTVLPRATNGVQCGQSLDPASVGDQDAAWAEELELAKQNGKSVDVQISGNALYCAARNGQARLESYGYVWTRAKASAYDPVRRAQDANMADGIARDQGRANSAGSDAAAQAWEFFTDTTSTAIDTVLTTILS